MTKCLLKSFFSRGVFVKNAHRIRGIDMVYEVLSCIAATVALRGWLSLYDFFVINTSSTIVFHSIKV